VLILGDQNGSKKTHATVQDLSNCITDNSIPIIVVSSCSDQDVQKQCFEAGCHAYLTKPIQPKLLHDALYSKVVPIKERRKYLRSSVDLKAEFSIDKQHSEILDLVSLSKRGCLISSPRIVTTGTKVKIKLSLANLKIPLTGTVLYTLTNNKESGYVSLGVLFHNVNQIHADMIEQYLETILAQDNLLKKISK
jgi:CheY-like chemotaxis protein